MVFLLGNPFYVMILSVDGLNGSEVFYELSLRHDLTYSVSSILALSSVYLNR